jgi:hypothetical protein
MTITLALGSRKSPKGRIVQLGSFGHSNGGGVGGEWPVAFASKFSDAFAGRITPGREYIIYVEGDTKVDLDPRQTVAEFLSKNVGNYLIVTARLN